VSEQALEVPMNRSFDIFLGSGLNDALWLERIEGLDAGLVQSR